MLKLSGVSSACLIAMVLSKMRLIQPLGPVLFVRRNATALSAGERFLNMNGRILCLHNQNIVCFSRKASWLLVFWPRWLKILGLRMYRTFWTKALMTSPKYSSGVHQPQELVTGEILSKLIYKSTCMPSPKRGVLWWALHKFIMYVIFMPWCACAAYACGVSDQSQLTQWK